MWFDILKDVKQISDVGIKTKIGTRPLTITDEEDESNFPCCEEAREQAISLGKEKGFKQEHLNRWEHLNCEDLFWALDGHKKSSPREGWEIIIDLWQKCIFEQGTENPKHDEQRGWYVDYRDVGYR